MTEYLVGAWFARTNPQRLRLEGKICQRGHKIFPPKAKGGCPTCSYETSVGKITGTVFEAVKATSSREVSSSSK